MKKAIAIIMLLIFLFNVGGYYLALWAVSYATNEKLEARIEKDLYSADETIEFRIALSVPYLLHPRGFERVDGTFEHDGKFYRMLKQKFEHDAIVIVCLKNTEQTQMVGTITDYVKISNDLPGTAKKSLNFFGKLLKDYEPTTGISTISNFSFVSSSLFDGASSQPIENVLEKTSPPPRS